SLSSATHLFPHPSFSFYYSPTTPHLPSFPTRRSSDLHKSRQAHDGSRRQTARCEVKVNSKHAHANRAERHQPDFDMAPAEHFARSEEHTSELQSRFDLVCRLLLEKKKKKKKKNQLKYR